VRWLNMERSAPSRWKVQGMVQTESIFDISSGLLFVWISDSRPVGVTKEISPGGRRPTDQTIRTKSRKRFCFYY
jgi:hypothetical protein